MIGIILQGNYSDNTKSLLKSLDEISRQLGQRDGELENLRLELSDAEAALDALGLRLSSAGSRLEAAKELLLKAVEKA